jgi:alpha-glucosidase
MPWRASAPHAGFSDHKPWLPVDPRHLPLSVDRQSVHEQSMLSFSRKAIAARRTFAALRTGAFQLLHADAAVLAFARTTPAESLVCIFNLSAEAAPFQPKSTHTLKIAFTTEANLQLGDPLPKVLPPLSAFWLTP